MLAAEICWILVGGLTDCDWWWLTVVNGGSLKGTTHLTNWLERNGHNGWRFDHGRGSWPRWMMAEVLIGAMVKLASIGNKTDNMNGRWLVARGWWWIAMVSVLSQQLVRRLKAQVAEMGFSGWNQLLSALAKCIHHPWLFSSPESTCLYTCGNHKAITNNNQQGPTITNNEATCIKKQFPTSSTVRAETPIQSQLWCACKDCWLPTPKVHHQPLSFCDKPSLSINQNRQPAWRIN